MTIYVVHRFVTFPGGTVSWPLKAFEVEAKAKEACQSHEQVLRELDMAVLAHKVAGGMVEVGLELGAFLAGLGLVTVSHRVVKMDTVGLIETPAPPGIVLNS